MFKRSGSSLREVGSESMPTYIGYDMIDFSADTRV